MDKPCVHFRQPLAPSLHLKLTASMIELEKLKVETDDTADTFTAQVIMSSITKSPYNNKLQNVKQN